MGKSIADNPLQAIVMALMTAVFIWVGYTVTLTSNNLVKLETQIQNMAVVMTKLEEKVEGTHLLKFRLDQHEARMKMLEEDVDELIVHVSDHQTILNGMK